MHPNRTGTEGRRSRNAETTRAAIVQAAVTQFAQQGFANASIDRIAGEAQVTKGAVYHHFKDKAQLFEAAFVVRPTVAQRRQHAPQRFTGLDAGLDSNNAANAAHSGSEG